MLGRGLDLCDLADCLFALRKVDSVVPKPKENPTNPENSMEIVAEVKARPTWTC